MTRPLLATALLLAGGCGGRPEPPPHRLGTDPYPGALRPVEAHAAEFLWRQRITARWGKDDARSFDVALQKRDDQLTIVGLSPFGTVGFVLTLGAGRLTFENRAPEPMPFPPRYIALDAQRVFYPWLGPPPAADGPRGGVVDGEEITEVWADGRLVERTFRRQDHKPKGLIRVTMEGWSEGRATPARAVLHNGWFGYRLEVETLDETDLTGKSAEAAR